MSRTIELVEVFQTDTGTWGWTTDGQLWCSTCDSEQAITCPACQGNTCDCNRRRCAICADPTTECGVCDNTGRLPCPTCDA